VARRWCVSKRESKQDYVSCTVMVAYRASARRAILHSTVTSESSTSQFCARPPSMAQNGSCCKSGSTQALRAATENNAGLDQ
jgi:hypothetical protein